jgi:3-methyladenine DNA glycosylase AlkD
LQAIRREFRRRASPAHARQTQRFFKQPVRAYGWRTADVRRLAARLRREMAATGDDTLLLSVAEKLFSSQMVEEQALGVILLERAVRRFDNAEFRRLERWLAWVRNWAVCDALTCWLLGPMIAADRRRLPRVFRWAKSKNRWHRRASAVSLIPAARQGFYLRETLRLSDRLLRDDDYMVQKGVGWLLKEATKKNQKAVVAYLMKVRRRAPRLILRTACEKLPQAARGRILA